MEFEFVYTVGIHDSDNSYTEIDEFKTRVPVSIGDSVAMHHGDDEWEVFEIVHTPNETILHVKSVN